MSSTDFIFRTSVSETLEQIWPKNVNAEISPFVVNGLFQGRCAHIVIRDGALEGTKNSNTYGAIRF